MAPDDWGSRFEPTGEDGRPLELEELPLSMALARGQPSHRAMHIRQPGGELHEIEVTAFPIVGRTGLSGAIAIFWDAR